MGWLVPQQAEFMRDLARLIDWIHTRGMVVTGGELSRTREQQELYFRSGKSKTMNSQHMKRLAIDLNIFRVVEGGVPRLTYEKAELQEVGDYWESLSKRNRWGGNWKTFCDTAHFEKRDWDD